MAQSQKERNDFIRKESEFVRDIFREMSKRLVGQERLTSRMLIALLTGGHILIEGVPGLAKTLAVKTLAATVNASFQRVQFTPDLLPSDLVGTMVYQPNTLDFVPRKGPVFAHMVLADEINRAPAKVQSALLECMEEGQVTLGDVTYPLPRPFMVLATQNPIEQEGTYPLPEAQLDRFMLKVLVTYPSRDEEREVIQRMARHHTDLPSAIVSTERILQARAHIDDIYVADAIIDYVLDIITATRSPAQANLPKLEPWIAYGASPRASIALVRAAKALAFLQGRGHVVPDDIKALAADVLRHRIVVSFEALADNITSQQIIQQIVRSIEVP